MEDRTESVLEAWPDPERSCVEALGRKGPAQFGRLGLPAEAKRVVAVSWGEE